MSSSLTSSIILFVFLSLLLTILAYEIKKWIKVSAAPILLILGLIFREFGILIHDFDNVFALVDNIDPHLITLGVMPALLYETGMKADWFTFRREVGQIILMATTVVLLSSFLSAAALKYILLYEFTWNQALLLGVILNATDHVAVLSQFKDIYANEKFETLIGGETLLNEATVMVLFNLMLQSSGSDVPIGTSFSMFFRLTFGGLALGIGFAVVMGEVLKRIVNDYRQETLLTFITAYLLFYTAESSNIHVSGAIAVVTLGLYMSAYGKTLISPIVEKPMHHFWTIIATNLESFVFIIGGMLLGNQIINSKNLTLNDLGMLFSMFLILHLIRFIVICVHYPLLRYIGYGITVKEIIVLTFSGIKGVISIALSLIAYNDSSLSSSFSSLMLFFTVGIVSLTIILDSFCIKFFVKIFRFESLSEAQESTLVGVTTAIFQDTAKNIERFRSDKEFDLVKWKDVLKVTGDKRLLHSLMKTNRIGSVVLKENLEKPLNELIEIYSQKFNISNEDLEKETRDRLYNTLKAIYWHDFESGQCQGYTSLVLINSCNVAQETNSSKMNDWEVLEKVLTSSRTTKVLLKLSKLPLVGRVFKKMIYKQIIVKYDAAVTFIRAHEESVELMDKMEIDADEQIFKDIVDESHQQVHLCEEYVKYHITDEYPEIISQVQSNIAARTLLISQRKLINKIYNQGVIKEIEYECLQEAIDENIKSLINKSSVQQASLKEILKNRFKKASSKHISDILPLVEEKHFKPQQVIFTEGEPVKGAYLIFSGRVHEFSDWIDQELRVGNILGAQHLLPQYSSKNTSTAVASTVVQAAFIPKSLLKDKIFLEDLYKEACEELILLNIDKLKLQGVKHEYILRIIKSSTIMFVEAGMTVNLHRGGWLLYGKLKKRKEAIRFIKPKEVALDCYEDCVIMFFPQHLAGFYKQYSNLQQTFSSFYIRSAARKASTLFNREENAGLTMQKFNRV